MAGDINFLLQPNDPKAPKTTKEGMKGSKQPQTNTKRAVSFVAIVARFFLVYRERFLNVVSAWVVQIRSFFLKQKRVLFQFQQKKREIKKETPPENIVSTDTPLVDVNLLPFEGDRSNEKTLQTVSLHLVLAALITLVAVGLVWGGVRWFFWVRDQRLAGLKQEEAIIEQSLKTFEQRASHIEELERRITSVRVLLNRHVLWTQFFSLLERYTLPDVYYTTLSVGLGEKISMTGIARDFETLARQLLVLEKASDFVQGINISSAQAVADALQAKETGDIRFTIELDLNPSIFYFTP